MALVSVAVAGIEIAGAHAWRGVMVLCCIQGAYVVGLLVNAMRR